jgi:hypothetical protein
MTPHEKAAATLKRHKAEQRQREAGRKAERELIKKNLLKIIDSDSATAAEKLEASRLLLELKS